MKKILSFILVLAMVLSCLSIVSFATGEETNSESTFKAAKFTELDLTSRGTYFCSWNSNVFWKAADVTDDKDGTFGYKYTIYNIGTEAMKAQLSFNTVTYSPTNVPNTKYPDATVMPNAITEVKTIEPGESADLEISIAANNGWVTYVIKGTTDQAERTYSMPLNYVAVRLDLATISGNNAARKFVIESKGCDGVDYFVDAYTSQKWQKEVATREDLPKPVAEGIEIKSEPTKKEYKTNETLNTDGLEINLVYNTGDREPVTDLGNCTFDYDFSAAGTQTVTVKYNGFTTSFKVTVAEPKAAGIQWEVKTNTASNISINDYNRSPWASDATFTGQKKLNYVVYNTSSKEVKVTLYITMMSGGSTKNGDAETTGTITIPAGYKGTLSALVNVENGTVKMKADGTLNGALDTIRLRFVLNFTGGATAGDSVIFVPVQDGDANNFVIKKFAAGGVNKSEVTELPEGYSFFTTGLSVNATKTQYANGEDLDKSTLTVTATMSDGTTQVVSDYTVSGYNKTTAGTQTVTVTYEGVSATFEVTVAQPKYVGVKYTFTSATDTKQHSIYMTNYDHFNVENPESFTGSVTKTYTLYNHTSQVITYTLNFAIVATKTAGGDTWVYASSEKYRSATVYPGKSATLTIVEEFKDGAPVDGYASSHELNPLSITKMFPQISIQLLGAGAVGEFVVISAPAGDGLYYKTHTIDGIEDTVTKLTELPELEDYDLNAAYKVEVQADLTSNNYPRVSNELKPITHGDIIEDETGRYILLQYRLYNMNPDIKNLKVWCQTVWAEIHADAISYPYDDNDDGEIAVQPYSSQLFTVRIEVEDDNTVLAKSGSYVDISTLSIRFLETQGSTTDIKKYKKAGETYYIQALNDTARIIFYKTVLYQTNLKFTTLKESELNQITTFAGAAPEIGSSIAMNIVVVPMQDYISGVQLKVTRDDYVTYLNPISVATINNTEYRKEWGTLVFKYTGINAQCMGDNLTFELVYGDETVATKTDYSVKVYAQNVYTNGTNVALDNLLRDMLVYGAEAQKSSRYKTDALVTDGVSWAVIGDYYDAPEFVREIENNNATSGVSSATLNISYVNKIRFTLVDASQVKSVTINGVNAKIEGNHVYSEAIKATEFADVFELVVTTVDDQVITVRYNANAYIAKKMATSSIAKALNNYGNSALAYKG